MGSRGCSIAKIELSYLISLIVVDLSVNLLIKAVVQYECSIATGCIYSEAKNYPREPAAHVAISNSFFSLNIFYISLYFLDVLIAHVL